MRVLVLGGTRFIGRAIVRELLAHVHAVQIVHRGVHETHGEPEVPHLHVHRRALATMRAEIEAFAPEGWIDVSAMTRDDAMTAVDVAPARARLVVISSVDVYRAFGSAIANRETDAVPIAEDAPLRTEPLPPRPDARTAWDFEPGEYDKRDVESIYRARGAIVVRAPMTYGEHDPARREEFVLRRIRAGRTRVPVGAANWLWSRGYVADIARGVRLALEAQGLEGEIFNLCERETWTIEGWMRRIARAANAEIELVRVPDATLPADLELTRAFAQPLLFDASKARARLGWTETPPDEALIRSVRWHLANPPSDASIPTTDFAVDDAALAHA
jgi:UDP-glucose 4-epimerase